MLSDNIRGVLIAVLITIAGIGVILVADHQSTPPEPKFIMSEFVTYKVSKFYSGVCTGLGIVSGVKCDARDEGGCKYTISTTACDFFGCPDTFEKVRESDLTITDARTLPSCVGTVRLVPRK